jgi:hypothetical protein
MIINPSVGPLLPTLDIIHHPLAQLFNRQLPPASLLIKPMEVELKFLNRLFGRLYLAVFIKLVTKPIEPVLNPGL